MRRHPILSFVVVPAWLLAAACTGPAATLDSWVGAPKADVVKVWGQPTATAPAGAGGEVLEYQEESEVEVPTRTGGSPGEPPTVSTETQRLWCVTRLETSAAGVVTGYTVEGNSCHPPARP